MLVVGIIDLNLIIQYFCHIHIKKASVGNKKEITMDKIDKHELEYYLYILNDESLTYQDKVEVLEEKIKERLNKK